MPRRKPLSWTEPEAGHFTAVGYQIQYTTNEEGPTWRVWREHKAFWHSMGYEPTLKAAMQSCARHRRMNY